LNLGQIIASLSADDTRTIVAKRPWTENSEARLVSLTDECRVPSDVLSEGFEYFLEVDIAVNDVLGDLANRLSPAQRIAAGAFYAENDAYPDWLNAMSRGLP
jgi:hypothetical protein